MEYALYYRSESGDLTRDGYIIDDETRVVDRGAWVEEQLHGWPERLVYWNNATGSAIGYAPCRGQ